MANPTPPESPLRLRGEALGTKPLSLHAEFYGRTVRALQALLGQDPTPVRNPTLTLDERLQLNATVVDMSVAPFRKNGRGFALDVIVLGATAAEANTFLLWNKADHLVAVCVDVIRYGSGNSTQIGRYGLCFPPPLTLGGADLASLIQQQAHYTEDFVTPSPFTAANGRPGAMKSTIKDLVGGKLITGAGSIEADGVGADWHGTVYPQDPTGTTEPREPDTIYTNGDLVVWPGCALIVQQTELNKSMRVSVRGRIWDFGPKETRPIGG